MKLANAARHFDKQVFTDAYGTSTFNGQMNLFDDSVRDGLTVERRIISVAPTVVIPARKTVKMDGQTWILGDAARDYFKASSIRHKYVAHLATDLAAARTFEQQLMAQAGLAVWTSRVWVKGSKEIEISSEITNVYDLYFASTEALSEGMLVQMGGQYHLIRSLYPSTGGFLVALVDALEGSVVTTASFSQRVYQPLTDTYQTTPIVVSALFLRWQSHFRYPRVGVDRFKAGDKVAIVLKSAITPKAGDAVTVAGQAFTVKAVLDEGTCWGLHLRDA